MEWGIWMMWATTERGEYCDAEPVYHLPVTAVVCTVLVGKSKSIRSETKDLAFHRLISQMLSTTSSERAMLCALYTAT